MSGGAGLQRPGDSALPPINGKGRNLGDGLGKMILSEMTAHSQLILNTFSFVTIHFPSTLRYLKCVELCTKVKHQIKKYF